MTFDTVKESLDFIRESPGPAYFNHWTLAHIFWGVVAARYHLQFAEALILHTGYEGIEGYFFTHRDESMENHVGDTIAFAAGFLAASKEPGR